jgi:hypothetical protein
MKDATRANILYLQYEIGDMKTLVDQSSALASYMLGLEYIPGTTGSHIAEKQFLPNVKAGENVKRTKPTAKGVL